MKEFSDASNFKSYDQLRARLDKALGFEGIAPKSKAEDLIEEVGKTSANVDLSSEEDEDLNYFKSLAKSE